MSDHLPTTRPAATPTRPTSAVPTPAVPAAAPPAVRWRGGVAGLVRRHPVLAFVVPAVGVTWVLQFGFVLAGLPLFPAKLVELVLLVGLAVGVTRVVDGRGGVRALFGRARVWRFGPARYLALVAAMPLLTLAVAAVTGTLQAPDGGWLREALLYVVIAALFGTVLGNLWEELAWTGHVQRRLADRHGLLRGAMLTAVPFGLIHLPLAWEENGLAGTSGTDVAITWTALAASAPFLRYVLGVAFAETAGSVLAVGLLHGAFNASSALGAVDGGWQYLPALVLLALITGARRTLAGRRALAARRTRALPRTEAVRRA
jgi:membrane protease YdiL (CAAX protease family)